MSGQSEDAKDANVDRSRRERRQMQDRQEATADRSPEVPDPRLLTNFLRLPDRLFCLSRIDQAEGFA